MWKRRKATKSKPLTPAKNDMIEKKIGVHAQNSDDNLDQKGDGDEDGEDEHAAQAVEM